MSRDNKNQFYYRLNYPLHTVQIKSCDDSGITLAVYRYFLKKLQHLCDIQFAHNQQDVVFMLLTQSSPAVGIINDHLYVFDATVTEQPSPSLICLSHHIITTFPILSSNYPNPPILWREAWWEAVLHEEQQSKLKR